MQEGAIGYITKSNSAACKLILLVDDDEDEHEIFLSALKSIDKTFDFVSAYNCDKALDLLKELDPHYIFIDVNMPKTNGMVCLQEIKRISRIAQVPVYMYSTGVNANDSQRALQMGAVDYIIKPNSITALTALLKKIIV